jgi:hypothetical protein
MPVRREIADTVSPSRCSSRIIINSPRVTTAAPHDSDRGSIVGDCAKRRREASRRRFKSKTGEISSDHFGDYSSDTDSQRRHGDELTNLGAADHVAKRVAQNARCWWRNSNGDIKRVLTLAYFDKLGVPRLS